MLTKTPFALAPVRFVFRPLPAGTASHKIHDICACVFAEFFVQFTEFVFFVFSSTLLLMFLSFFFESKDIKKETLIDFDLAHETSSS